MAAARATLLFAPSVPSGNTDGVAVDEKMREQERQVRSVIWSAVLVQEKGRALAFETAIQSSGTVVRSSRGQKTPRSTHRLTGCPAHRRNRRDLDRTQSTQTLKHNRPKWHTTPETELASVRQ